MIESINIRNVATYDLVGVQIESLRKVNFFYGANGSGKTTITKMLNDPSTTDYQECSITWKGGLGMKSLVYNKQFREKNFGKGTIDGVFTLGQATKEELELISLMKSDQSSLRADYTKKKETLEKKQEEKDQFQAEFKEKVWKSIYKKHETEFKEAFTGVMSKDRFVSRLLNEFSTNQLNLKSLQDLKESSKTIFGSRPEQIQLFDEIVYDKLIDIGNDPIWKKKIIGKADVEISKLIQKLNINDWVNEGRSHLQESKTCPFCQEETITDSFRNQLENYFDEEFTSDIDKVNDLNSDYDRFSENLVNQLTQMENAEKAKNDSKLDVSKLSILLKTLTSQITSNKELFRSKAKEPSRTVDPVLLQEQLKAIEDLILLTNVSIGKHNQIVSNYDSERESLILLIWKFIVEDNRSEIETYQNKFVGLEAGIGAISSQLEEIKRKGQELKSKIQEANKNVTSVQPSVDEINRILKSYGFLNFEIVPSKVSKNQYQIQREDGSIAESTLSEGEVTFITFLYFLQLAKGSTSEENITEDRILIVDDPISSLDSNVLFVVSSLIKEIIKAIKKDHGNIKQLLLFTHNVYFHKEVSFIDGRTKKDRNTFFWILRKKDKISTIQSFEMTNPIQSSYELLWQELKNREANSAITVQNTMRRIIENYFKILGKYGDDELIAKFSNAEEQEICRSLICWINEGSHGITDDLYVERHDETVERYMAVFRRIFEETNHLEHYNMMMGDV